MNKRIAKEQNPWANINIIDIICELLPKGYSKYLPLVIKEYKKKSIESVNKYRDDYNYYRENYSKIAPNSDSSVEIDFFTLSTKHHLAGLINEFVDYDVFNKHNEHHKNNRLENPDISSYGGIDELVRQVTIADIKYLDNETKKAVHIMFEDDIWMVLKPLTFDSSLKYGASTKWCTSSRNNPGHYYRYSKGGGLYYIINKKTFTKTGVQTEYHNGKVSISLYDEEDDRVDSAVAGVDANIIHLILDDTNKFKTNLEFIKSNYPEFYELHVNWREDEKEIMVEIEGPVAIPVEMNWDDIDLR